ncbi:MAG: DEAD/DEAH box helicase [Gammaproteobacteria bacterium]|jgi:ATP-dependent RNA helicase RhlB|nr:DEAD/DEAH box helicase [Gammaproteobacteria bacterium]MBT5333756.1 DEAD/DEAH box helicase [Gammaproteobacteria bacterium]MBT5681649.1 DEAD/DEAH box helicase [Gammaproteobacteria bacterium]MBT6557271.1 DEAD/DEAH box helicase [Gammaproteobacteria bacterium]
MLEDNGENQDLDKAKEKAAAENAAENSTPETAAEASEQTAEQTAEQENETVETTVEETAVETESEQVSDTANEADSERETSDEADAEAATEAPEESAHDGSHATTEEVVEETAEVAAEETVSETPAAEETIVAAASETEAAVDEVAETEEAEAATETAAEYETVRFQELALPEPLVAAIDELGFEFCTPIQGRSLPFSLSDYDVTGQAQTGTGKTAAFLITLFTRFWENPLQTEQASGTPRALVLAPTRELAMQIEGDAQGLSKHMGMRTVCVVGGMDYGKQREELEEGPVDVLVATPGRLIDFVERREINLREVEVLVIDEADRMLDMGFIPDVRRIVLQTPHKRKRQTLFFSATFNDAVMRLAQSWTIDAEHIIVEPESVATDTVDQKFWLVGARERQKVLFQFLSHAQPERAIIFANRRDQTHRIVEFLRKKDIPCEALAGDVPQRKRMATLARFKEGKLRYLIATDVAGRGIHVDGVTHVVNYELPDDSEDYVHRIGRTGRAGASGTSISFVSEDDAFNLPALEQYLGTQIKCIQPDLLPDS